MKVFLDFIPLFILLLYYYSQFTNYCNHISGVISDSNGEPLPFASIYIKNTTYGVSSNAFGEYFIELDPGEYTIVYSYIGYDNYEKLLILKEKPIKFNVVLREKDQNLIEYEVVSDTKNKALEIIKKVKTVRKNYDYKNYSSTEYSKNTIEKRQYKLKEKTLLRYGNWIHHKRLI